VGPERIELSADGLKVHRSRLSEHAPSNSDVLPLCSDELHVVELVETARRRSGSIFDRPNKLDKTGRASPRPPRHTNLLSCSWRQLPAQVRSQLPAPKAISGAESASATAWIAE
jgi:hypothetical protein